MYTKFSPKGLSIILDYGISKLWFFSKSVLMIQFEEFKINLRENLLLNTAQVTVNLVAQIWSTMKAKWIHFLSFPYNPYIISIFYGVVSVCTLLVIYDKYDMNSALLFFFHYSLYKDV